MAAFKPDPSFYPSPESAIAGPPEELAYVVTLNTDGTRPDALNVFDVNSAARVGRLDMPNIGDELHISVGTRARRRCARGRRTHTSNAATSSCPGCARRASTSSTS